MIRTILEAGAVVSEDFIAVVLAGAKGDFLEEIFDILPRGDIK